MNATLWLYGSLLVLSIGLFVAVAEYCEGQGPRQDSAPLIPPEKSRLKLPSTRRKGPVVRPL